MVDELDRLAQKGQEKPVIQYQAAEPSRPVTRGERIAVLLGYLLLGAGVVMTLLALKEAASHPERRMLPVGIVVLMVGAGVTGSCYIYNAVRRM